MTQTRLNPGRRRPPTAPNKTASGHSRAAPRRRSINTTSSSGKTRRSRRVGAARATGSMTNSPLLFKVDSRPSSEHTQNEQDAADKIADKIADRSADDACDNISHTPPPQRNAVVLPVEESDVAADDVSGGGNVLARPPQRRSVPRIDGLGVALQQQQQHAQTRRRLSQTTIDRYAPVQTRATLPTDKADKKETDGTGDGAVVETEEVLRNAVDYMHAANPSGKKRVVGAPKRNRKEQLSVREQVQASNRMARSFGLPVEATDDEATVTTDTETTERRVKTRSTTPPPTPPPSDMCCEPDEHRSPPASEAPPPSSTHVGNKTEMSASPSPPCDTQERPRLSTSAAYVDGPDDDSDDEAPRRPPHRARRKTPFLRSLRREAQQREQSRPPLCPLRVQRTMPTEDDHEDDDDRQRQPATAVVRFTRSTNLEPYDYSAWDDTREYNDETFAEFRQTQHDLFEAAVVEYAQRLAKMHSDVAALPLEQQRGIARKHLETQAYGTAAVSMEDFDITRMTEDGQSREALQRSARRSIAAEHVCQYPRTSNLRCRYDHHTFDGIPILLPLRYHAEPFDILEVIGNMVFCSFACALAHLSRCSTQARMTAGNDQRTLLQFMARRWFGISEPIRMAPLLEQHRDYGGRLSTAEFRAFAQTHYSFVEYPLAVAIPARYVTEIIVSRKMDRAKRQGLSLRTAEQHVDVLPDPHPDIPFDPSCPAAPRGPEARARAAKRRAESRGADGKPKQRVAVDDSGRRIVVDRQYVEKIIQRTAEKQRAKPKRQPAIKRMLNIREVRFEDEMPDGESSQQQQHQQQPLSVDDHDHDPDADIEDKVLATPSRRGTKRVADESSDAPAAKRAAKK